MPQITYVITAMGPVVPLRSHQIHNLTGFLIHIIIITIIIIYIYIYILYVYTLIEGSLEVKLPTIWTDEKAKVGRVREEKRREEERRSEKRKSQKKEDAGARKGRKVAKHRDLWLRRVESRLAKAAGAEPSGQMRDEQLHAVVARSTFRSQNVTNAWALLEVEMLKKRTALRRDSKSKCTKHTILGALFAVRMCFPVAGARDSALRHK